MNKDLFLRVYKNVYLNSIINNQIRNINVKLYKKKTIKYNWKQLIQTPVVLTEYGYYDQLKLQIENSYSRDKSMIDRCIKTALRQRQLHILKYFIEEKKPRSVSLHYMFEKALYSGDIPMIEYVYSLIDDVDYDKCNGYFGVTAASGSKEVCEWYLDHFKDNIVWYPNLFYFYATSCGNLDILKWGIQLFDNIQPDTPIEDLWRPAIKSKNISLLDFMYNDERFKSSFDIRRCMYDGIITGNFEVLDWIFSKNNDSTAFDHKDMFTLLIQRCSLKIIEFCSDKLGYKMGTHKNKAEWFFLMCDHYGFNAVDYGVKNHFDKIHKFIIWIYENTSFQGTFNPLEICNRSLELLRWFTEHNRPEILPPVVMDKLLMYDRSISIVEYIIRYRTEQFPDIQELMEYLLLNSESIDLLDMLAKEHTVAFTHKIMEKVIFKNRLEAVKWIHNNTTVECTKKAMRFAYSLKDSSMVEWLHQNRTETCDTKYIKNNFHSFSTPVQSFIIQNKPRIRIIQSSTKVIK